jgi:hypothetical protein
VIPSLKSTAEEHLQLSVIPWPQNAVQEDTQPSMIPSPTTAAEEQIHPSVPPSPVHAAEEHIQQSIASSEWYDRHNKSEAQERFMIALLGEIPPVELQIAYQWYMGFLEHKIREAWKPLFSQVVKDMDPSLDLPSAEAFSVAFELLGAIVLELRRKNLALTDIVDKFYNKDLLKETDDERSHANQLIFTFLGWISVFMTHL